ncbi:MAG: hypothetical protein KKA31_02275 [Candidatus Margulisbacteria bacterium]|nr:hypothetical protein [Candidatus Margulisiibacteriota bacterium]
MLGVVILILAIIGTVLVFSLQKSVVRKKGNKKSDKKAHEILIDAVKFVFYFLAGWAVAAAVIEYASILGISFNDRRMPIDTVFTTNFINIKILFLIAFLIILFRVLVAKTNLLEKRAAYLLKKAKNDSGDMFILLWDTGWTIVQASFFLLIALSLKHWYPFLKFFYIFFVIDIIAAWGDIIYSYLRKERPLYKLAVFQQWVIINLVNLAIILFLGWILSEYIFPDFAYWIFLALALLSFSWDFVNNKEEYLGLI